MADAPFPLPAHRTGRARFHASGSRTRTHAFAHGKLRVRSLRRISPSTSCRYSFGEPCRPPTLSPCACRRSHWRSRCRACRSMARYAGAHRAEAEVVRPAQQLPVQLGHPVLDLPSRANDGRSTRGSRPGEPLDLLRRRARPDVGPSRPRRVAPADRVAQKVERLLGDATQPRLGLVDRQLQPRHHRPHRGHRLVGGATTADHEVVRVVDDLSVQPAFVSQGLPTDGRSDAYRCSPATGTAETLAGCPGPRPCCGSSGGSAPLVDLLDRRLQPHLDQPQEVPIADATGERLEEFGVRDVTIFTPFSRCLPRQRQSAATAPSIRRDGPYGRQRWRRGRSGVRSVMS